MTLAGVVGVGRPGQQVVGPVERDEALGVARGARRWPRRSRSRPPGPRGACRIRSALCRWPSAARAVRIGQAGEEAAFQPEGAAAEADLGLALALQHRQAASNWLVTCAASKGEAITARAFSSRQPRRRGQRGGAAAGCGRSAATGPGRRPPWPRRRRPGRRRRRRGPRAPNSPSLSPRPVKSKRSTATPRADEGAGDAPGGERVLAAGEAVGEQGVGPHRAVGRVHPAGEGVPARGLEIEGASAHRATRLVWIGRPPFRVRVTGVRSAMSASRARCSSSRGRRRRGCARCASRRRCG